MYVEDRQGGSTHPITTGTGEHTAAAWGPNSSTIAFLTTDGGMGLCLATVRADGTHQRILLCSPNTPHGRLAITLEPPLWGANGKSVYIEATGFSGGLEPEYFYSRVYRVNVWDGTAVLLTEQTFGDGSGGGVAARTLVISPDGKHGVYTNFGHMMLVDFQTGARTPLATQGTPVAYSRDGSKIAFNHGAGDSGYSRAYVMNADGSHVRAAIANPDPEAYFTVADWSYDGTHLLVNKVGNDRWLKIVNLATGRATTVTKGTARPGAWFHP